MRRFILSFVLFSGISAAIHFQAFAAPAVLTEEDVTSLFAPDPALRAAEMSLNMGDTASAAAHLAKAENSDLRRFLDARRKAAEASRTKSKLLAEDAAKSLLKLTEDFSALSDFFAFEASEMFSLAEKWKDALEVLKKISPASRYYRRASFRRAELMEKSGDLKSAYEAFEALASGGEPRSGKDEAAEALAAQARIAKRLGKSELERSALLRLWRDHPRTSLTLEQEKIVFSENRKNSHKSEKGSFSLEDRLKRAERLVELHHNRRGIEALSPIVEEQKFPSSLSCRARFAMGDAYRKERRHEKAIELLTPVVEKCPAQKERALYALASSQSIAHPERGSGFYDRYIREFSVSKKLDQAEWFAADLEIKNGKFEAVSKRLERLIRVYPKSRYAPEALFKLFWLSWTSSDSCAGYEASQKKNQSGSQDKNESKRHCGKCTAWLEHILKGWPGNVEEASRAKYWMGRVRFEEGKVDDALKIWGELAEDFPQRFYGEMALTQLEKNNPSVACDVKRRISARILGSSKNFDNQTVPSKSGMTAVDADEARRDIIAQLPRPLGALQRDTRLESALLMMRLGLHDEAKAILNILAREKQSREDRKTLAILLGLSGDLRGAQVVARIHFASVFEKPLEEKNKGFWILAWPRAYRSVIEEKCYPRGVAPDQLQALMREESALDPHARSWAGALGLTQFMPARAREVAKLAGRSSFQESDLFDPKIAIELGCTWLGRLLSDFNGERMHAFAAYNADTRRVKKWDALNPDGQLDRFVEQIPIAETRNYVKRLVRSEATYRWLYSVDKILSSCKER